MLSRRNFQTQWLTGWTDNNRRKPNGKKRVDKIYKPLAQPYGREALELALAFDSYWFTQKDAANAYAPERIPLAVFDDKLMLLR